MSKQDSYRKEIQRLELIVKNSSGTIEAYKNLILEISKIESSSIPKKTLLESLSRLQKESFEQKLRAEGALDLARKIEGGFEKTEKLEKTPSKKPIEEFEEEEEFEEDQPSLDDNIKHFYGLEEDEENED